jgi:HD-GYP domain-containing protein (c-di-GMP phosphodiesterase class II)
VTIADIFDALTTNRSYKTAASCFTSFKTMKIVMKDQLNMKLVDQLIKLMGKSL